MKKDLVNKQAIIQRDRNSYAIAPHTPGGFVTPSFLRTVCDVAEKYGIESLKLTSAQRIALFGIREEDVDAVWRDLGAPPGATIGLCVRSIKICPGTTTCKRAVQDSVALGLKLDARYHAMELPNKVKMGVSGCMLSCAEVAVKDIGVMGTTKGWTILVGGTAGARPRLADTLVEDVATEDDVIAIIDAILSFYKNNPNHNRLGRIIEAMGLDAFRRQVLPPPGE